MKPLRALLLLALLTPLACGQPREPLPTPPPWTPVPRSPQAISPENAGELRLAQCAQRGVVRHLAFSPDGRLLAVGSGGGLFLYDARSMSELRILDAAPVEGWRTNLTYCVAFAPNGETLASGSLDGAVRLWRAGDGALLRTLQGHKGAVVAVGFAADSHTIASAALDMTVRIWRVADGELLRTLEGFQRRPYNPEAGQPLTRVAFSPDGAMVVWAANDQVRLWRVSDGKLLRHLRGLGRAVHSVAFSPDGTMVAAGSYGRVMLWRIADGARVRAFDTRIYESLSVALSPDGTILAQGTSQKNVLLYRVSDGQYLSGVGGQHGGFVKALAFSPDGSTVASGAEDGTRCLWGVEP